MPRVPWELQFLEASKGVPEKESARAWQDARLEGLYLRFLGRQGRAGEILLAQVESRYFAAWNSIQLRHEAIERGAIP